jgi:hypothetical protein
VEQAYFDDAGALTVDTAQRLAKLSARFDARGHQVMIAYFGVDDRPLLHDGAARSESTYDASGDLVAQRFFGTDGNPRVKREGYASFAAQYDGRHKQVHVAFFDAAGKPTLDAAARAAGWSSEYDAAGREVSRAYVGTDGRRSRSSYGYSKVAFAYDERGYVVERSFFDTDDKPMLVKGYAKVVRVFDDRGDPVEVRYLGTRGEPLNDESGVARESKSNTVEESFYDKAGLLVVKGGYGRKVTKFDARGKPIETSYYGADGRSIVFDGDDGSEHLEGWRIVRAFDDDGHEIERATYGTDGARRADRRGVAIRRFAFDETGLKLEEAYFGADEKPVLDVELGYAKEVSVYNAQKKRIEHAFYGAAGELVVPKAGKDRYARATFAYDARGHEITRRTFGATGAPMKTAEGLAARVTTFDNRGNAVAVDLLGEDGRAATDPHGAAGWRAVFNAAKQETERTYIGQDGQPASTTLGYARYVVAFDKNGGEQERRFFDAKGAAVADLQGCYVLRAVHSEGGGLVDHECLDANGQRVTSPPLPPKKKPR